MRERVRETYAAAARAAAAIMRATKPAKDGCCATDALATCCGPGDKAACCGEPAASAPTTCGCGSGA